MSTFKPPAESLTSLLFKNATALFFIVILGLFAGTFFFYKSSKSKQDLEALEVRQTNLSQRQYVSDENSQIEVTGMMKAPDESINNAAESEEPNLAVARDIKDLSAEEIRQNLENQLFKKDGSSKDAFISNKYELRVYFAEVSGKGLEMLIQEARASGQSSSTDFVQGVINLPMPKVLSYRDDFSVYTEISKAMEKNKSLVWFQGLKGAGPDSDIGLSQTALLKDSPNGRIQLEIKVTKRFQVNSGDGLGKDFQSIDFLGSGEIEKTQTYFMAEILSKYPMSAQQEYLTSLTPFEIYKSQNFLGGKTYSVFFYTVENK